MFLNRSEQDFFAPTCTPASHSHLNMSWRSAWRDPTQLGAALTGSGLPQGRSDWLRLLLFRHGMHLLMAVHVALYITDGDWRALMDHWVISGDRHIDIPCSLLQFVAAQFAYFV